MYSRQGSQYIAEDILRRHDFVAPEKDVDGRFAACKVSLMPRGCAIPDAEVAAVKAFLTAGGRVIAGEKSGECDYLGVWCRQRPLEGLAGMPEAVQIPFNDWRGDRRIVAEDALNARVHGCCRGAYECCLKVG